MSCPTKYFEEASSISFWPSLWYGLGCMRVAFRFRLCAWGMSRTTQFTRRAVTTPDVREGAKSYRSVLGYEPARKP